MAAKPAKKLPPLREADLYPPLRDYLEANGYTVRGEVHDCDVTATKDGDLILIELKRAVTLKLLTQAARRQRLSDSVYVAVPRPANTGPRGRTWRDLQHLLRRLELGLILVETDPPTVEVAFHPRPFQRRKQTKQRRALLREAAGRSGDYNAGGVTGRRLVTAYRERAVHIACALEHLGPSSPKALRALGTGPKTTPILRANYYGWFEHLDRALYGLSAKGLAALDEYAALAAHYRAAVQEAAENS